MVSRTISIRLDAFPGFQLLVGHLFLLAGSPLRGNHVTDPQGNSVSLAICLINSSKISWWGVTFLASEIGCLIFLSLALQK